MTGIYGVSKYRMKNIQPAYETVGIPLSQLPPITVLPMVPRNEDPAISAARLEAAKGKWAKMNLKKHAKGESKRRGRPSVKVDKVAFVIDAPQMTSAQLCAKYGIAHASVVNLCKALGVEYRRMKTTKGAAK